MRSRSTIGTLLSVWVALLVLLTLTTASSYVPLGIGNTLINGVIAVMKTALIASCFMHLGRANTAVRFAAGAALLFLFFLAFLSFGDFLTRPHHPAAWQAPAASHSPGGPY
jgi:cytochrome c oxidase subunit IV